MLSVVDIPSRDKKHQKQNRTYSLEYPLSFKGILKIDSFHDSSIYSDATIKQRNLAIFTGEAWESITDGITGTMYNTLNNDWRQGADNSINFLDIINQENLMEMIFSDWTNTLQAGF